MKQVQAMVKYTRQAAFNLYAAAIGIMIAIKRDKPTLGNLVYFAIHLRSTLAIGLATYHTRKPSLPSSANAPGAAFRQ